MQQAEHERHQRETEQLNGQLRALLDKVAAESSRHSSAVQGLVRGVDEGLQQLTAASIEAGLEAGRQQHNPPNGGGGAGGSGGGAGNDQDVHMEDEEGAQHRDAQVGACRAFGAVTLAGSVFAVVAEAKCGSSG